MVLVLEEEVITVICAYAPQVGRLERKKNQFHDDMASEWDLKNPGKVFLSMGDFNGHVGRRINNFEGADGGYEISKKNVEEEDYLSFVMKRSHV